MNDETWLRNVLKQATAAQPRPADRVRGVFAHVARRRRQRAVAASCAAVVALFLGSAVTGGGGGSVGLRPVTPPNTSPTPEVSGTPSPATSDTPYGTASPAGAAGTTPSPSRTPDGDYPPIDVLLSPPPAGGVLDVYVLLDGTASMTLSQDWYHRALVSIDGRLDAERVDRTWGWGLFRDVYDIGPTQSHVYLRQMPQGKAVPDFSSVQFQGGGDEPDGQTLALDGAVGIGHTPYTTDTDGALFRPGATKVVLLLTDAKMHDGGTYYPTIDQAIQNLRAHGVVVVALQVLDDSSAEMAHRDLTRVATGTGGVAGSRTDCDGDGHSDIARGAPLVCQIDGSAQDFGGFGHELAEIARRR
jgi:hypothetical protein